MFRSTLSQKAASGSSDPSVTPRCVNSAQPIGIVESVPVDLTSIIPIDAPGVSPYGWFTMSAYLYDGEIVECAVIVISVSSTASHVGFDVISCASSVWALISCTVPAEFH